MNKNVAIYIRVSTQEQATEGYSIQAQKDRLLNYCKARDWNVYDIYIDPGFSGSNLNRPGIKKLISNINEIEMVLVYKLDRLSRSQKDTLHLIEDVFLSNNVDFVSMNESFDTATPFGRAMVGILSVFAQLEREQIKERSLMGREERAKSGLYHGGWNTPTGYRYNPETDELLIDPHEAEQIKLIYSMYLSGKSMTQIRNKMRDSGFKTKYGEYRYTKTISNILSSPVYAGKIVFRDKEYDGQHEPIITYEDYKLARDRVNSRKKYNIKHKPSPALLTGSIWCGKCGARYNYKFNSGKNVKTPYLYYTCYSRSKSNRNMIKDPHCKNRNWKLEELDSYIESEIFKISTDKNVLMTLFNNEFDIKTHEDLRNSITKEIKKIDSQIDKLMDLYSLGSIPISDISEKIKALNLQKDLLEEELSKYEVSAYSDEDINSVWNIVFKLKDNWPSFSIEERRQIVKTLINRIILDDDTITIEWSFL